MSCVLSLAVWLCSWSVCEGGSGSSNLHPPANSPTAAPPGGGGGPVRGNGKAKLASTPVMPSTPGIWGQYTTRFLVGTRPCFCVLCLRRWWWWRKDLSQPGSSHTYLRSMTPEVTDDLLHDLRRGDPRFGCDDGVMAGWSINLRMYGTNCEERENGKIGLVWIPSGTSLKQMVFSYYILNRHIPMYPTIRSCTWHKRKKPVDAKLYYPFFTLLYNDTWMYILSDETFCTQSQIMVEKVPEIMFPESKNIHSQMYVLLVCIYRVYIVISTNSKYLTYRWEQL